MDDPAAEAPQLDLTSIADEEGDDALQVTLSDSMDGVVLGDAFAIDSGAPAPSEAATAKSSPVLPAEKLPEKTSSEPAKPHKPNVQLGDDRFVAALLGLPMEAVKKPKKGKSAKSSPAVKKPAEVAETVPVERSSGVGANEKSDAVAAAAAADLTGAERPEVDPAEPQLAPSDAAADEKSPAFPPDATRPASQASITPAAVEATFAPDRGDAAGLTPIVSEAASPRPQRRTSKPSGPLAATAPVTVFEPEAMPDPVASAASPTEIASPATEELLSASETTDAAIAELPTAPPVELLDDSADSIAASAQRRFIDAGSGAKSTQSFAGASDAASGMSMPAVELIPPQPLIDAATLARDFALPPSAGTPSSVTRSAGRATAATLKARSAKALSNASTGPLPATATAAEIDSPPKGPTGAWWTLPLMFVGLMMIACALIVPVADENHRAAYELAKIERDVAYFQSQSDTNQSFLARVSTDPALAERLAMRQLNMIRPDEKLAAIKSKRDAFSMSPFALVSVDPPAPMAAYHPIGGFLSRWFLSPKFQIYFVGLGLLLTAAGVVFGGGGNGAATRQVIASA